MYTNSQHRSLSTLLQRLKVLHKKQRFAHESRESSCESRELSQKQRFAKATLHMCHESSRKSNASHKSHERARV